MFNGVPNLERIRRLVEKQLSILESWSEGSEGGLSADQIDQLRTLAMIVRQLGLEEAEIEPAKVRKPDPRLDALLAKVSSGDETA